MDLAGEIKSSDIFTEEVFASVLLVTYNQEKYVESALLSLLNQDYENLEIIVSDDCSSDSTWNILNQVVKSYHGPKIVILNRNTMNVGLTANRINAFNLSRGKLIFFADGDDVSLNTRCSECIKYWTESKVKFDLIASDGFDMAESGEVLGKKYSDDLEGLALIDWAQRRPYIFGASFMFTRDLYDDFNKVDSRLKNEDQCFLFRAIIRQGASRLPSSLIMHRRGGMSQLLNWKAIYRNKKDALLKSAENNLIEYHQFLNDANKLNRNDEFVTLYEHYRKHAEYGLKILTKEGFFAKLYIFFQHSNINFWKRIRYLGYALFQR